MTVQFSTAVRNSLLDTIESTIGVSAVLKFFTGAPPANCAAANTGTELASITCPSDWQNAASAGSKTIAGLWQVVAAGTGTAGHFRLYDTGGTVCGMQGTVTITAGGGDMTVDNTSFAPGQTVTVVTFTTTAPGA